VYKLHAELRKELGIKYLPLAEIYHYLLYHDLSGKYKTLPLKQVAEVEGVSLRTLYYFLHTYVKRRRRRNGKKNTPQKIKQ